MGAVGFDDLVDRVPVRGGDVALEGADDARRDAPLQAEGIPDGDDRVADAHRV